MATLAEQVSVRFKDSPWQLGFAESCTGGLISSQLTALSGVSSFYRGTVVSYHGDVKRDVLKVSASDIKEHGQVSEPVALQMARGAQQVLAADWAVSVTGVAGPTGGTEIKPVGTVCFAVVGPEFERVLTHHFDKDLTREQIQLQTANKAFELLLQAVNE
tara:strand:+ start:33959 stop:34438 length:480 start_codon:yes stop_codon:yes gene_type:complete